jgi:hypothetical protein
MAEKQLPELLALETRMNVLWLGDATALFGPTPLVIGQCAAMVGRIDEARAAFDRAIEVGERFVSPPMIALARAGRDALVRPSKRPPPSQGTGRAEIRVVQEGDVWRLRSTAGGEAVLKDAKGVYYLAELVRNPGREMHVTQLADLLEPAGDAGPVLDTKAKDAYRRRLEDLRDGLEEAQSFGDTARVARVEAEIDALVEQLAGAVGLGGRDRKMGSHIERARINVQRRLKDVLRRIEEQDPTFGRWLAASIKTGTWCVFSPV